MQTILAYLWTPVLMAMLALGLGLLVEHVVRWRLPPALLAPVGVATAISLVMPVYKLHGTAAVAAAVVAAGAVAGLVLSRRELRDRLRPGWACLAALAAYGLYIGPAMLTGHWTWAGYNFVNDTSVNFVYVDLLAHHGFAAPDGPPSLTTRFQETALALHYPLGPHALLAALWPLSFVDLPALYQPFIAACAAGAACSLCQLARRAGLPGPAAAAVGALAVSVNLLYRYGQHGAIKEILMVLLLATAAAVVAQALVDGLPSGAGAVLALALVPTLAVFSAAGAPYLVAFTCVAAGAALLHGTRRPLRGLRGPLLAGIGAAVLAALPVLSDARAFGSGAGSGTFSNGSSSTTGVLGHLVRELPLGQAAGVWFGQDYRYPMGPGHSHDVQTVLIAAVFALAGLAVVNETRHRRFGVPMLFAVTAVVLALVAPRLSPYADAKLLIMFSPALVLAAGVGVWMVRRVRRVGGVLAATLGVALGGGVLASAAIAGHETRFAPPDRMDALHDAADHAGKGLVLFTEWEEYAKYFARGVQNNPGLEPDSPKVEALRAPGPLFNVYYDLDELTLEYVEQFPGIVMRRSPTASRPPANFRLTYRNAFYEVWRRDAAGPRVAEHLPLQRTWAATDQPVCAAVRQFARAARAAGQPLLVARRPTSTSMDVTSQADRPNSWPPDDSRPGIVTIGGIGVERGAVTVTATGRYHVWLQGSMGRAVQIRIDGRLVGAPHQVNTPEQFLSAGDVQLSAGRHEVELKRPHGRPLPGDGYDGEMGPLVLEPVGATTSLERVAPSAAAARSLCGERLDWIERIDTQETTR